MNLDPVVFCNTLSCFQLVKKLQFSNIRVYWYIHEWYEEPGYFAFIKRDL